ncbi:MAG: type IV pilin [Methanobacteriota archaeon]
MKPRNQSNADERAVSPVIGVILMVAITVILAAVIGTFVLGLGDQLGDTAPQASFEIDGNNDTAINVTKTGGQTIDSDDLVLSVNGERESDNINKGDWESGEQKGIDYEGDAGDGATVRIIHEPSGSAIFEDTYDFESA